MQPAGPEGRDWIREAPDAPGFERMEAGFAGHAFDPHRHDSYGLGLTLAGVQCFDYRGSRRDSLAGHALVLHPDERHDGRAGGPMGFRYRMLYLAPELVSAALDGGGTDSLPFVPGGITADRRLGGALAAALSDLERPLEPLERTQLVLALAEALRALDPSARPRGPAGRDAAAVERARALLEAESARAVTAEELEAASGLDRFRLLRQFRARLGTSPYRYLTLRRLERVRALVRGGESLAEAALAAGFADQAHMTRRFRAAYGLSPGRWRAMIS
ncbi:transcriptional regulator, AraC family [Tistlia consotensis]|uniref:Transcriptional regulator, AraC family n=1 Tax=Tistlia consotensis USBA 355 TaxID=560819 RepID=A0A1Y6CVG9_9PROT|nr:AraC family transcriptional regulator [Tistlia consotensis]SMF77645.1 transcriptional regulator, AraC family [Tistlia consotensis USBA 355]SNS20935.1 transcriptional regulator, AraC family [Tistlia consotensis]